MTDLITVIVPIYKVEEYLDECIGSIISQTYTNLEIILVDDGSPDQCPIMCDEWAKKDSRIRVIHKENGGLSDARNAGIAAASGDYLAFVDSDDWILPEMYLKMLETIKKEDADICSCNINSVYQNGQVKTWGSHNYIVAGSEIILNMLYNDTSYPVSAWNKLYKKKCWERLRFPKGKICEDAFTTYLQIDEANKIVHLPEAYYCYRIRPQSIMTSSFSKKKMDEEEAWRRNYEFMQQKYPRVCKKAYDFYLQKVNCLIMQIPENQKEEFSFEYSFLKKILKKNKYYVLFQSNLGVKQRLKLYSEILKI